MNLIKELIPIQGFNGAALHSGVKRKRKDLALIYSEIPCVSAGVFTQNITKAAPVVVSEKNNQSSSTKAIVINSGNANACTGQQGFIDAEIMIKETASALNIYPDEVLLASTGIIGVPLQMGKITAGIKACAPLLAKDTLDQVAEGIKTTDTFEKKASVTFIADETTITLTGMAKGSGMIHPNMATMLGFILTDCPISKPLLQQALSDVVKDSFNMVSVDGDTSTNDMVLALSNGSATMATIVNDTNENYLTFKSALKLLCEDLSKQIAKDGEGASKLLEVNLQGAKSEEDAKLCAKSVISSSLVKAAFFGNDANWGRILCSLGYSGGQFTPEKVDLHFESINGSVTLMNAGVPVQFCEEQALKVLSTEEINIHINLNDGEHSATAWGCDLTYDYVKINGEYRT